MDLLDQEASEDEGMRRTAARSGRPWTRPASLEANVELTKKEKRYRDMLDHAAKADDIVHRMWDEWEEAITRLTWEEVSQPSYHLTSIILRTFISARPRSLVALAHDVIGEGE